MEKATHFGTCQWCGAQQKLPAGKMAKHGYTVRNGWFQGVCPGSGTAPFEQSCALVARSIAWARERRNQVMQNISAALALDPMGCEGWRHTYHPELYTRLVGSAYLWEFGRYEAKCDSEYLHCFVVGDKRYPTHTGQLSHKVQEGNRAYTAHLQRQVAEIEAYVIRQQQRVNAWTLQPLAPISADDESRVA